MRVYLGGPINGCTDEEAHGWRDELAAALIDLGYEPVDPMRRDYRGREMEPGIANEIVKGDLEDINSCSILVFNCPKPSYGTAMEIFYGCYEALKRVIIVLPDDGREPSPWLVVHSHQIVRGSVMGVLDLLPRISMSLDEFAPLIRPTPEWMLPG